MIADLIGLEHCLGARYSPFANKVDCFFLCCEVRRRLGLYDFEKDFEWVYKHPAFPLLPSKRIIHAINKIAVKTNAIEDGNVVLSSGGFNYISVGVCYQNGILLTSHQGRSVWLSSYKPSRLYKINKDVR